MIYIADLPFVLGSNRTKNIQCILKRGIHMQQFTVMANWKKEFRTIQAH
jgi:hypothetical protein